MKQTAVELLEDGINKVLSHLPLEREDIKTLIQQAKEMEKQQIMDARLNGFMISGEGYNAEYPYEGKDKNIISKEIDNEQYYNETFKSE